MLKRIYFVGLISSVIFLNLAFSQIASAQNLLEGVLQQAAPGGMEVIHNAKVVPSGAYGPGQMTMPAGTEYNGFSPDGVHTYYKNKSDTLTTAGTPEGIKYVSGKGIVKYKGKLYCFGF
jgi:hypothetical protein